MSIFEKAFEKADKGSDDLQDDALFSPEDDLPGPDGQDNAAPPPANKLDVDPVPPVAETGSEKKHVKLNLDAIRASGLVDPLSTLTTGIAGDCSTSA